MDLKNTIQIFIFIPEFSTVLTGLLKRVVLRHPFPVKSAKFLVSFNPSRIGTWKNDANVIYLGFDTAFHNYMALCNNIFDSRDIAHHRNTEPHSYRRCCSLDIGQVYQFVLKHESYHIHILVIQMSYVMSCQLICIIILKNWNS